MTLGKKLTHYLWNKLAALLYFANLLCEKKQACQVLCKNSNEFYVGFVYSSLLLKMDDGRSSDVRTRPNGQQQLFVFATAFSQLMTRIRAGF